MSDSNQPEIQYRALAVDDQREVLRAVQRALQMEGIEVECHTEPADAEHCLRTRRDELDVAIFDVSMPTITGFELLERARELAPDLPVVMLTSDGTAESAVRALKAGAFNYLVKAQLADPHAIGLTIRRAAAFGRLQRTTRRMQDRIDLADRFGSIIGSSAPMRAVFQIIEQVAALDVNVLILGESGTGKEMVARAIHERSQRASRPFVALNCAALPEELVDSELFGHKKGAFTGALSDREGACGRAHGGTLFLDEIGDMPAAVQLRMLRVLQEREIRPLGSDQTQPVDIRVIAATLVDLESAVEEKEFRPDLYYRLNVVTLELPPLRARKDDIPELAAHFLAKHAARMGRQGVTLSPEALEALDAYHWPGNVRELENAIQRALALAPSELIPASALPERVRTERKPQVDVAAAGDDLAWADGMPLAEARKLDRDRFEHRYLTRLLRSTGGNLSQAARIAGVDRSNLRRILSRNGMSTSDFTDE